METDARQSALCRRKIFRNPDSGVSRFGSTGVEVGICRGDNIEAKPSRVSRGPKMKKGTPCRGRGVREGPEDRKSVV